MSKELLVEYPNLLLINAIEKAKVEPTTSLEKYIRELPPPLLDVLTRQREYIIDHILKPLLNTYNIIRDYTSLFTKYYVASRVLVSTLLLAYIEKGEIAEFKKFVIDIAKNYHNFRSDLQKLKDILTEDELDTLSFTFLSACEYNLGIADRMSKLEMDVFDFLKKAEVQQLVAYANVLDCVLSSASTVSAGDVELNDIVVKNLKLLINWATSWADELFNMCIRTGISRGYNVLEVLPEVKEKVLKEIGESLKWLALKLSP